MRSDLKPMRGLCRIRRWGDEGFTLVEVIFAIFLATLVLIGGSMVLLYGLRSTAFNRQAQQSADLATQKVESWRDTSYAALAMNSADASPATDSRLIACGTKTCFVDPKTHGQEPLSVAPTGSVGAVSQHIEVVAPSTHNGTQFTRYTYVTQPTDASFGAAATYKRVTVIVDWTSYGRTHEREESTLVTRTTRGLALPAFSFNAVSSNYTSQIGADAHFQFTLTNLGARTLFNLSASGTATWTYWIDVDNSGGVSAGDTQLTDTNGDALPDILVNAGGNPIYIVADRTVQANEAIGSASYTFTATPVPDITPSAAKSASVTLNVQQASPTIPPTYTLKTYHLGNKANVVPNADTTSQTNMPLNIVAPTGTAQYDFSTDIDSTLKFRTQRQGGTGIWQMVGSGGGQSYAGTAVLTFWAQPVSQGATSPGGFSVTMQNVQKQGNGTITTNVASSGSFDLSPWGTSTWQKVSVSLPIASAFTLKNGDYFTLTVTADKDMRFAYDNASLDSTLQIGVK